MSYTENNLLFGEEVIYRTRLHWVIFMTPAVLLILALALAIPATRDNAPTGVMCAFPALLLYALFSWLSAFVSYLSSEFAVTSRRVLIKVGFIRRHSLELLLSKVEGIGVDQGIAGRVLGYGTITVTGTGGTREPFPTIVNPLEFRRQVQAQIDETV